MNVCIYSRSVLWTFIVEVYYERVFIVEVYYERVYL